MRALLAAALLLCAACDDADGPPLDAQPPADLGVAAGDLSHAAAADLADQDFSEFDLAEGPTTSIGEVFDLSGDATLVGTPLGPIDGGLSFQDLL